MSGGGYQPIWLFEEPIPATPENTARVESLGSNIATLINGDGVQNIDRILRVPFTRNFPDAKKRKAGRPETISGIVIVMESVQ